MGPHESRIVEATAEPPAGEHSEAWEPASSRGETVPRPVLGEGGRLVAVHERLAARNWPPPSHPHRPVCGPQRAAHEPDEGSHGDGPSPSVRAKRTDAIPGVPCAERTTIPTADAPASCFGRFRQLCYFRPEAHVAGRGAGTGPMHAGGDMGPVARWRGAQVAAVKQLAGLPVALAAAVSAGGDGADPRVRPRGPPSSASDSAVGR
jgi:hypothetical protein